MTRPVHGYPIGPEPGNPVVFRGLIKKVAPGGMVKDPTHVPDANVISPGNGYVDSVYHILPVFIVKVSVLHGNFSSLSYVVICIILDERGKCNEYRDYSPACQGGNSGRPL
jgi:hypothetical protein